MINDDSKQIVLKGLSDLLIADQQYKGVLKYFSSRQRISKISDINQLAVYIREFCKENFKQEMPYHIISITLHKMVQLGLGKLSKRSNKQKIEWDYWPTPLFDNHNRLIGVRLRDLNAKAKDIEEVEITKTQTKIDITQIPIEDLLKEITRRGFAIRIDKGNQT